MKKQMSNQMLLMIFAAITGGVIALIIWLYLKIVNLGITVIWEMIPNYFDIKYYTIIMCLVGGVVVGVFHRFYGPYPESMKDAVGRVKKEGSYPYQKLPVTMVAAFLSLFFGGAVGPESGLVCLLLGMVFWALDQFGMARYEMEALLANNPYLSRAYLLKHMLRGYFTPLNRIHYNKSDGAWERKEAVPVGVACGLTALIIYVVLNHFLGSGLTVPHLQESDMYAKDRVGAILLIVVGIAAGYLQLILKKLTSLFFSKLREKKLDILNALLGGLILGIVGTCLPMTMFSGGNDISAMQYEYLQFTPYLLILIGVVKLFLTNVCIESGWRGGHFFPLIFSGISIGYGFAILLGTNQIFSVVVVTTAMLATTMQQPIGAIVLAVIFFPLQELGWILVAGIVGGCLPVPKPLRAYPEDKGFIYNMSHRKKQKWIAEK